MILHSITPDELRRRIDEHAPGWRAAAKQRARAVLKKGRVEPRDATWSKIKDVFIVLQGGKCMYCERPLPTLSRGVTAAGRGEHDVEHHRPKNRVAPWPPSALRAARRISYDKQLRSGAPAGYLHLAFEPENYGASCRTCNSELKRDYFPIAGKHKRTAKTRAALDACELPCVPLPLGDPAQVVDPERWLVWSGPLVRGARLRDATTRLRARTLVDFFELDTRPDLLLGRCTVVCLLLPRLAKSSRSAAARRFVAGLCDAKSPFAGCARGFCRLYERRPAEAREWARRAEGFLVSKDPSVFRS